MADIIELITADHNRIRRLMRALDSAARYGETSGAAWAVAGTWRRLASLLDVHTAAEAEIWYPAISRMDLPAASGLPAAIAAHDRVRAALQQVGRHDIASVPWWGAVAVLLRAWSGHLGGQEPLSLQDLRGQITPAARSRLGEQWGAFVAGRAPVSLAPPRHPLAPPRPPRPPAGQRLR